MVRGACACESLRFLATAGHELRAAVRARAQVRPTCARTVEPQVLLARLALLEDNPQEGALHAQLVLSPAARRRLRADELEVELLEQALLVLLVELEVLLVG